MCSEKTERSSPHSMGGVLPLSHVGIIVNPASGKDIRRLIANGSVVTNQEKINTVIRMIMAMDALGVDLVTILPDPTHMGKRVIEEVSPDLSHCRVELLAMNFRGTFEDSLVGTELMRKFGVNCIVVLGGDGTSRVVAKQSGAVPLLPISTGTNNVFPRMVEGTLAGIAVAQIATGQLATEQACNRKPRLELLDHANHVADIALVDLAVLNTRDLGSRAVWEPGCIRELCLTTASPTNIGLSAIGGWLCPDMNACGDEGTALHIEMAHDGEVRVMAPIAPGMMQEVRVSRYATFRSGMTIPLSTDPGVIALDGEREVIINADEPYAVRLNPEGPVVIDLERTLSLGAQTTAKLREVASGDDDQ